MNFIKETPDNIKELIKMARDYRSWKTRLEAVEQMKKYDCQQVKDVIARLALHDKVYRVKEEAFKVGKELGIKKHGKPIFLGRKDIGYKSSDFTKVFKKIRTKCEMENFNLNIFKENMLIIDPEMYDVMSYEKGPNLDMWIKEIYKSLPDDQKIE
ncbi:HEAT repeat domain-containing protein [Clostridium vincentii]|uniref:HEAT repeat domain-containing protein n=1 Tax=Clostridium vincentii TaxID=52704 RepID=A0A2T0B6W7_9CLOT|nr:HEAT repeat domain-containing protein [Clostridium vincentii]PRR79634.1 hypothetical protein CLVI_32840 [Clostridium vincentii]